MLTPDCEVSIPKKTSPWCKTERYYERAIMKFVWKLTENPFGFMVLDRKQSLHLLGTFPSQDSISRGTCKRSFQWIVPTLFTTPWWKLSGKAEKATATNLCPSISRRFQSCKEWVQFSIPGSFGRLDLKFIFYASNISQLTKKKAECLKSFCPSQWGKHDCLGKRRENFINLIYQ